LSGGTGYLYSHVRRSDRPFAAIKTTPLSVGVGEANWWREALPDAVGPPLSQHS
jgi:hypothetical protein